jgi:hypothetical protein
MYDVHVCERSDAINVRGPEHEASKFLRAPPLILAPFSFFSFSRSVVVKGARKVPL